MLEKIKNYFTIEYLFFVVVFWACLRGLDQRFVEFGFGLRPIAFITFAIGVVCLLFVIKNRHDAIDICVLFLALGMTRFFSSMDALGGFDFFTMCPVFFYIAGKQYVYTMRKKSKNNAVIVFSTVVFCSIFLLQLIEAVEFWKHYTEKGYPFDGDPYQDRGWLFWATTEVDLRITVYAFLGVVLCSFLFVGIMLLLDNKKIGWIVIAIGIYSFVFYSIRGSRNVFLSAFIVFVVNLILWMFEQKGKMKHIMKKIIFLFGAGILIFVCIWALFCLDLLPDGVENFLRGTLINGRSGGIIHNDRFKSIIAIVRNIGNYPLGGMPKEVAVLDGGHSVWTQAAVYSGRLSFVYLVIFSVITLTVFVRYCFSKRNQIEKHMLISLYVATFLYSFIEPLIMQVTIAWVIHCLICGVMVECVRGDSLCKD